MADDLSNRGAQDRSRINMHEDYEVRYWAKHLDVTRAGAMALLMAITDQIEAD